MIVQTLSMAFWYNAPLTFQILESAAGASQATIAVFSALSKVLPTLKHDFELRRLIFGLTAIISTPVAAMPAFVAQQLAEITKQMAVLAQKMRAERVKILEDNEKHLVEEEERRKKGGDDDDEEDGDDEGFVDEDGSDDDEKGETEASILKRIAKARSQGATLEGGDDDDGEDDDDDDSDYEYTGGDLAIYDSALDDVDELLFVKDALERLNTADAAYTQ